MKDKLIAIQNEDFSDFPLTSFPYDKEHSAMGEYHYCPPEGYTGNWYSPIADYGLQGPLWMVTQTGGRRVMESQTLGRSFPDAWNMLVTGDSGYTDYVLECEMQLLTTAKINGLAFRYQNSRCFYAFCFTDGQIKALMRVLPHDKAIVLETVEYQYESFRVYSIKITSKNDKFTLSIDGEEIMSFTDDTYTSGKIALIGNSPAQFSNITVSMTESDHILYMARKQEQAALHTAEQAKYPQPKLWKQIDLKDFGCGRSVRFGDLTGDGHLDILFAQCQRRMFRDRYAHISCLTAVDTDGNILWQLGEPHPDNIYITADLPVQIADIDGDGLNEVIVSMDFQIMILEGATGKLKKSAPTPTSTESIETLYSGIPYGMYAFDRVNIDCIRICNFSGNKTPRDILLKDRYSRVYAYDNELRLLWKYHDGITGHFPLTWDCNGDGREEMFVGYNLVGADGQKLWTLPVPTDHTDEIIAGRFYDVQKDVIAMVSGDEGFIICDMEGNILVKNMVGHAQRISVGNYRPDRPGFEIAVSTFWGHQGIILIYTGKGELLYTLEPGTNGNMLTPVNWTGDGRDLILLNGNTEKGGLIDGYGHQAVTLPDDGHPELCAEALDITGDQRDELVVWDSKRMYIYTQDTPFTGDRIYAPEKYPHHNASNYRGEYAWPRYI